MAPLPAISQKCLPPSRMYLRRYFDEPMGGEGWTQRSAKDVSIERVLVDGSYPNRDGRVLDAGWLSPGGCCHPGSRYSVCPFRLPRISVSRWLVAGRLAKSEAVVPFTRPSCILTLRPRSTMVSNVVIGGDMFFTRASALCFLRDEDLPWI